MFRYFVLATLFVVGLQSVEVQAAPFQPVARTLNWGNIQDALFAENQTLVGNWNEKNAWKSSWCSQEAFYGYNVNLQAILDDVKIGLQEDGSVAIFARFDGLSGLAKGSLRNAGTFCQELKGSVGLGIQWAEIRGNVSFGKSGQLEDMLIQVTETRLGKLDMGKYFPDWFENIITGMVNRGLKSVWQSRLGTWLNKKITAEVVKRIPQQGQGKTPRVIHP